MICALILALTMSSHHLDWNPFPGPQTEVLQRSEKEILYGGARGPGKSEAGRVWMVEPEYVKHPGYRGLVLRKNTDDLADWIAKAKILYRPLKARFTGSPYANLVRFPSGCEISLGHLDNKEVYEKYQGQEFQKILFEELTQIPQEELYEKIIMSCRSTIGLPAQILSTTNPGGPGHVWVKQRFVDVARNKTYTDEFNNTRIFIPGKVTDNPVLMQKDPGYINMLRAIKDEKLRKAWLDGDWDVFFGQFFDKWNSSIHVVKPFTIPDGWLRYRGIDWGYYPHYAAVVWVAVDYENNHYIYREFYERQNIPEIFAQKVLGMTGNETINMSYADPSMWAKNQYGTGENDEQAIAKSIAQKCIDAGLYIDKANNDRVSGWANVRSLMYWDENLKPKLYVFDNCKEFIRTTPQMIHDKNNVEDMDTTLEDHPDDAFRYVAIHTYKPFVHAQKESELQEFIKNITSSSSDRWDANV